MTWMLFVAILASTQQGVNRPKADRPATCGDVLAFQVRLDRRGFSPGEIDGRHGPNLERALTAFQEQAQIPVTGQPDCASWAELSSDGTSDVLIDYQVTEEDEAGPFLEGSLPPSLPEQASLPSLAYASVLEALAERFHASPRLITRLNPGVRIAAGATIRVPAVTPFDPASKPGLDAVAGTTTIRVSRSGNTLRVLREDGTTAFTAPVSSGSEHDPLPLGTWKVTGTSWMPPFHYNPELFWDADATDPKAVIKPGPNNPVGAVWVDINVPHYGLHGTPTPRLVGHAQSHGCVRLTNWDAARLASLVKPGTPVVFDP
ncbi:MAG: L,D-transpeptidase family protein [Vicinamibacterales bacterium]